MNIDFEGLRKKLHAELDRGIDRLNAAKAYIEELQRETEAAIQAKLEAGQEALAAKRQDAAAARARLEDFVDDLKTETQTAVEEWKANRDRQKLEKRAQHAQKRAEAFIAVALYAAEEAEVAILEAMAARKDADDAQ